MLSQARRLSRWAPNITIKLPATRSGLDVMEECTALGIPTVVTASFTVPQAVAIGEGYARGVRKAQQNNIKPAKCFAVLMIGRLDDYLWDAASDGRYGIQKEIIIQAGIAVAKRTYEIFKQSSFEPTIMPAGMRGAYHMTELAGANMVFSIAPFIQDMVSELKGPFETRIDRPVDNAVIKQLLKLPEFVKAYEPDGMKRDEFIAYGVTQRTLSQFTDAGWLLLQAYNFDSAS
jgi:transaldolase